MVETGSHTKQSVLEILSRIKDPEIPVLSIQEMGMLHDVKLSGDLCEVFIMPTYSGCPAMGIIEEDIYTLLKQEGFSNIKVTLVYSPTWTTDLMSESSKEKLRAYGIAAPVHSSCTNWLKPNDVEVLCPKCNSKHTELISRFGSTACKALYSCKNCSEPFEYFKCH